VEEVGHDNSTWAIRLRERGENVRSNTSRGGNSILPPLSGLEVNNGVAMAVRARGLKRLARISETGKGGVPGLDLRAKPNDWRLYDGAI